MGGDAVGTLVWPADVRFRFDRSQGRRRDCVLWGNAGEARAGVHHTEGERPVVGYKTPSTTAGRESGRHYAAGGLRHLDAQLGSLFRGRKASELRQCILERGGSAGAVSSEGDGSHIDNQQDRGIYGLFPEFRPLLKREILQEAVGRLGEIREEDVRPIVDGIPRAWDVGDAARAALVTFAVGRARFLGDTMERELWPQMEFKFPD